MKRQIITGIANFLWLCVMLDLRGLARRGIKKGYDSAQWSLAILQFALQYEDLMRWIDAHSSKMKLLETQEELSY